MPHQSDHATRLAIDVRRRPVPNSAEAEVWLLTLSGRVPWLRDFAGQLHPDSVLCVLTTPEETAILLPELLPLLRLQLWVAVKLDRPRDAGPGRLPEHHAALLILSRYPGPLRHTTTRIAYTYCPACDRTTKDYGGKKHTYHPYGTLLSDVWRDLAWTPGSEPRAIMERLADLFGLEPYRRLRAFTMSANPGPKRRRGPVLADALGLHDKSLGPALVHGDCLEELRRLPDSSIDFCFADPPYNLSKRYDRWDDALDIVQYFAWCDRWLDELARVLRPGRTCAVLNIPQWAVRHFTHLRQRLTFQNWIAWEGLSLPVRRIMPAHYAILCFSKGPPRLLPGRETLTALQEFYCLRSSCVRRRETDQAPLTDLWWDIHRLKHNTRRVDHPCQLPPALMQRLIALFTAPGESVLDPFDGAGTTSLSAALLGRRFIGIELSETYHRLAVERHALLERGGDPFAKGQGVPAAKNSRVRRIGQSAYAVPKKTLQLEVRRIAVELGRVPTRDEVKLLGKYPIRYYDEYFVSWAEACAAARNGGMSERRPRA